MGLGHDGDLKVRWALGGGCYFPATRCSWKSLCTWNFCGQSLVSSVDKAVGPLGAACGYRPSLRRAPQPQAEGLGPRCPRFLSVPVQSRPSGPVLPAPRPPLLQVVRRKHVIVAQERGCAL